MTSPMKGKLVWQNATSDAELRYLNPNGTENLRSVAPNKISNDIVPSADGQNVEFTLVEVPQPGQRPRRRITSVTIPGRPFVQRPTIAVAVPPEDNIRGFINPYNFVPTVGRDTKARDLGDHLPAGHHQLLRDLYSGCLTVKMIVKTPLLVPDARVTIDENDHKTFDIRINAGQVLIPPTSVKGMLRSAYEAVTNSRFGIFQQDKHLAFRQDARTGLKSFPARVVEENGRWFVHLLTGTTEMPTPRNGYLQQDILCAAWLPSFRNNGNLGNQLQHGDRVCFKYTFVDKRRYKYNQVTDIKLVGASEKFGSDWTEGWVYKTGLNVRQKYDERVFFCKTTPTCVEVDKLFISGWKNLLKNYRAIHKAKPPDLSDHITEANGWKTIDDKSFLCYVHVKREKDKLCVLHAQPVQISRQSHANSPLELLDEEFRPASEIKNLSPADRVFGWTRSKTRGVDSGESHDSYAGQISIGPIIPVPGKVDIQSGTTLTILSGPKPQQTRFYLGVKNEHGVIGALPNDQDKILYSTSQNIKVRLRGRKIYPHHRNPPDDYWQQKDAEYCCEEKSDQNQTMQRWVGPDSQFTFTLSLRNLSSFELGALIYLLKLPKDHFHRLGGAKPLGFGSVGLELVEENSSLAVGAEWVDILENLEDPAKVNPKRIQDLLECFNGLVVPEALNRRAFERSAKGFDSPIHYPRPYPKRETDGNEGYNWFKKNEDRTHRLSLPDILSGNLELPYFPAEDN